MQIKLMFLAQYVGQRFMLEKHQEEKIIIFVQRIIKKKKIHATISHGTNLRLAKNGSQVIQSQKREQAEQRAVKPKRVQLQKPKEVQQRKHQQNPQAKLNQLQQRRIRQKRQIPKNKVAKCK